ncbi:MAG TPA: hypothetical protein VKQ05_09625 [Gemmatimonadales bacterium]|nr:hypothetical protein [Gemmatimonadales bacterium]
MPDLRPMGLGEVLDGALTIFRRHFLLFVKIGAVALWLPVALVIYINLSGGRPQHVGLALVASIVQYFAGLFLTASAIRVISDSYLGHEPQLGDAISLGASKIWPLFVVGLGKGIILGLIAMGIGVVAAIMIPLMITGGAGGVAVLAAIIAVVGGSWLLAFVACGYAVTTPIVVLENLSSSSDALGRSWSLTRDFKLKIFGIFFVTGLMVYLPVLMLGAIGEFLALRTPGVGQGFEVVAGALPIVLTPLLSCVLTLVYYDLRVRREGFDLQVLSEQLSTMTTGVNG